VSGDGYGITPDAVYRSGANIKALEPGMRTAGINAMRSIADAGGIAHHPVVSAALMSYHDAHVKDAHSLAYAVGDAGVRIGTTAVAAEDNENTKTAIYKTSATGAESTYTVLNRAL
jgi:hypothetical protein